MGSLMNRVYLDFNATTPVEPAVLDAMLPYFSAEFANAASIHTPGQRARAAVETAREQVAALIGARPQEIVFTSGGTESDNHAIFGVVGQAFLTVPTSRNAISSPHVITTAIEHEAVLNACQALEKQGARVTYLATDANGQIDLADLRRTIRPQTVLTTIMHANNELGTVQPLEEIGRIAKEADIYFHTDAVQSAGKIPIDVNALQVDLLSLSGHKLYAPKGIGALYVRGGTRLRQLLYGGHHQRGFRPGTENVAGIVGLGRAAEIARKSLAEDACPISALRDKLQQRLLQLVPQSRVNAGAAPRTPNTTNLVFPGVEGEALLIALDLKGLACSTGAACSSGAVEPSHVLTAIGLPPEEARASLSFSLGRHTTPADTDSALNVADAAVAQHLNFPHYVVNFEEQFEKRVVRPFVDQYLSGRTPIACTNCNTDVKFEPLLRMARQIGAERLATGHYARIRRNDVTSRWELLRARDETKDQSYFLWGLSQEQLSRSDFPLGELTKEEVRALARRANLPVAEKPESMELCFVPTGNYVQFIQAYSRERGISLHHGEGKIVNESGDVVGRHDGVHNFTIGQRKGLGFAAGKPLYVLSIDPKKNRVVVGEDDVLRKTVCEVEGVNWISCDRPSVPLRAFAKIRHKHEPAPAIIEPLAAATARVTFDAPQRAITPGQAAVFYNGHVVLGGGWIR